MSEKGTWKPGESFDPTKEYGEGGGGIPDPDKYFAMVSGVEVGESSNHNPQIVVSLRLIQGSKTKGQFRGTRFRDWLVLTENSIWRLENLCKAIGLTESFDPTDAEVVNELFYQKILYANVGKDGDKTRVVKPFFEQASKEDQKRFKQFEVPEDWDDRSFEFPSEEESEESSEADPFAS